MNQLTYERWNYFDDLAQTVLVTQTVQYQGIEGRPSARNTTATFNGVLSETLPQSFSWSRNGELISQTYPSSTGGSCPAGGLGATTPVQVRSPAPEGSASTRS